MLDFAVDPNSVQDVTDYLEQTRKNILTAIRVGMREGMEGLSWKVAEKFDGNPIVSRSGDLLAHILASPKVTTHEGYIKGTVDAEMGKKHVGLWLEAGINEPAVKGKLYQFTAADGTSVWTHGHKAFRVAPHPFMNPSLNEYRGTLLDLITQKIVEAANGLV